MKEKSGLHVKCNPCEKFKAFMKCNPCEKFKAFIKCNLCKKFKFNPYIKFKAGINQNLSASYTVETTLIMIIVIITLVYIVTMALTFFGMAAEYAKTAENIMIKENLSTDRMRLFRIIMRAGK